MDENYDLAVQVSTVFWDIIKFGGRKCASVILSQGVQLLYFTHLYNSVHVLHSGDKSKSLSFKLLCVRDNTVLACHLNLESRTLLSDESFTNNTGRCIKL